MPGCGRGWFRSGSPQTGPECEGSAVGKCPVRRRGDRTPFSEPGDKVFARSCGEESVSSYFSSFGEKKMLLWISAEVQLFVQISERSAGKIELVARDAIISGYQTYLVEQWSGRDVALGGGVLMLGL